MIHHPVILSVIAYTLLVIGFLVFNHGAAQDKTTDHYDP